jgi:hypothetical protein
MFLFEFACRSELNPKEMRQQNQERTGRKEKKTKKEMVKTNKNH